MENQPTRTKQIHFLGSGSNLFGIFIVNIILTLITLGFYYPWAKAATLKYLYQETELEDSRFVFHGTGKEMFKGFLKAIGIFIVLYCLLIASFISKDPVLITAGVIVFYLAFFLIIPIAIHGSMKYRTSRSSWRGIHFGYRGIRMQLLRKFVAGTFLSIISFGIYYCWFIIDLRRYIIDNIRFGSIKFSYTGAGYEYFLLNLKGIILTILTLGIYSFWYARDLYNYYVNNIKIEQQDRVIALRSVATGSGFFRLIIVNLIIVLFTLGIGTPWAMVRTLKFTFSNCFIDGDLDLNAIEQTEAEFKDATGDDLVDMMDIGLV